MRTLRVWVPPELMLNTESGTSVLRDQIEEYEATQSELDIILEPKVVSGQGGILSYLRSGRSIAPTILPDLIILPSDQLSAVFTDGLIVSMDALIDAEQLDELYPAAQRIAKPNDVILGYPYTLNNLTHLAYNDRIIAETIGESLSDLNEIEEARLGVALEHRTGAIFVLQLYLAAGGNLVNDMGQPTLESAPLILALRALDDSVESGVFNVSVSQGTNIEAIWNAYATRQVNVMLTTAQLYLSQEVVEDLVAAPLSGIDGTVTPLVTGWVWAVSSTNSNQQILARDLILHLTQPENLAQWSEQNRLLPAKPAALALWRRDDAYRQFLQDQLVLSNALPSTASAEILTLLQEAALLVISGEASPQTAAETAVDAMQP